MQLGQPPHFRNLADNWLKEFKDHNFKQVIINYLWLSNGRIGAPYSNNRLATFSIDIHSDDVDDVKYLVSKSHDLNINFSVWFSICFSIDSPGDRAG